MRITFLSGGVSLAGGDRVVATYAKCLLERGHEVFVVARAPRQPSPQEQIRSILRGRGWLPKPRQERSHFDYLNVPYVVIDRFRPIVDADVPDADVVVATWWETAAWVKQLSPSKGAKAYFIQHHEVFDYLPQEQTRATYSMPLHKIAISQWLVDIMATEYGDRNVSYVPNSVDFKQFYAPPRRKQETPTIGVMYNPTRWKGTDISLRAFSIAAEKIPNLRLIAFGDFPPAPQLPLPENAEYTLRPPQESLREFYSQCDVWLFGSRLEGFGLPVLEAMACRTPVIGTPAGAAPELLAHGAGILVDFENPAAMADAIVQVCGMDELEWQSMSEKAYARATGYTWNDATDLFEAALNTAVKRSQQGEL
jgi:glycosyltransferase involved in cell wall biosynthesis